MNEKVKLVNNAGMLELYRVILNLYNKKLIEIYDIKEFITALNSLLETLPKEEGRFLN